MNIKRKCYSHSKPNWNHNLIDIGFLPKLNVPFKQNQHRTNQFEDKQKQKQKKSNDENR